MYVVYLVFCLVVSVFAWLLLAVGDTHAVVVLTPFLFAVKTTIDLFIPLLNKWRKDKLVM